MKLKIFYIISDIHKSISFEWISLDLHKKHHLKFILITEEKADLLSFLKKNGIECYHIPSHLNILLKWFKTFAILRKEKPSVVHTHLWHANLIGLTSSWLLGIPKRIFTRHHAMVHYNDSPSGRKWDLLCNFLATDIIAISGNVKNILLTKDKANSDKIKLIHHGFPASYFENPDHESVVRLRNKYLNDGGKFPVVGVIARYMEWKGIQYIIPAFQMLLQKYPTAHLILANAHGSYEREIKSMLKLLPPNSYTEIYFENNLSALYQLFDLYVHVPIDKEVEAFGQTYIESLASGIPSVFTLSGIASDFIENGQNALVVPFKDQEAIFSAFQLILDNEKVRHDLIRNGKKATELFSYNKMISKLISLYES